MRSTQAWHQTSLFSEDEGVSPAVRGLPHCRDGYHEKGTHASWCPRVRDSEDVDDQWGVD
jgi:hypothetical protein